MDIINNINCLIVGPCKYLPNFFIVNKHNVYGYLPFNIGSVNGFKLTTAAFICDIGIMKGKQGIRETMDMIHHAHSPPNRLTSGFGINTLLGT